MSDRRLKQTVVGFSHIGVGLHKKKQVRDRCLDHKRSVNDMRTLGYALILFGIISAVIILIYPDILGWSGLTGSIVAVMSGIGFLNYAGDGSYRENTVCGHRC